MKKLLLLLILTQGCSALEILPGLCYTDRDGTYFCPDSIPLEYDRIHNCKTNYSQNEEEWRMCMEPSNDHIYDPYFKQRKEIDRPLIKSNSHIARYIEDAVDDYIRIAIEDLFP